MKKTALAVAEEINLHDIFIREDFADTSAVIAAVSGGSDSMALLLLLRSALAEMDNPPRLIAVTVDHHLRSDSAQEARQVAAFCAKNAIAHKIVCWQGEKPQTGLMARARLARYQLLAEQARLYGAQVIFTGHNFDDRAETYLMRAARVAPSRSPASMTRGLAAMARQSWLLEQLPKSVQRFSDKSCGENNKLEHFQQKWTPVLRRKMRKNKKLERFTEPSKTKTALGDIRLIRPLLETRRSTLRQFLQAHHVGWIDDPSNENCRFERVRLRHTLCEQDIILATTAAHKATEQRHCHNDCAIKIIQQGRLQSSHEIYQLDLSGLPIDDNFLPQFIADLASLVGGAPYLRPATPQLRGLLCNHNQQRLTLAGAVIEKQGSKLILWRERRNLQPLTIAAGCQAVWDRRFHIANNGDEDILIRAVEQKELDSYQPALNMPAMRLLAAPVIIGSKGMDMPTLQGVIIHNKHVSIKRILPPFEFLVADGDAAFVAHLKQIFVSPSTEPQA